MHVTIQTTRFGALDVDERKVLNFAEGLPGFEGRRRFALVPHHAEGGDKSSPFVWLQSLEDEGLAFLAMEPHRAFPDYAPRIPRAEMEALALTDEAARPRLYTLLTVPPGDPCGITANLMAPIVANPRAGLAKQVVLADQYGLQHRLLLGSPE